MTVNWHLISDPAVYSQHRLDNIKTLEGERPLSYLDSKNIPSIGIGFNLRSNNVRQEVFVAMGLDVTRLSDPAQIATEQSYINQLVSEISKPYASNQVTLLRSRLNAIMAQRATDPVLASQAHIAGRTTFEMRTNEIQLAFNAVVPSFETTVDTWLAGIPQSNERLALVSLAYNNLVGVDSQGNFKSPKLKDAIICW